MHFADEIVSSPERKKKEEREDKINNPNNTFFSSNKCNKKRSTIKLNLIFHDSLIIFPQKQIINKTPSDDYNCSICYYTKKK